MPRYFFDVNDGIELRDEIGRELEDAAVRFEALRVVDALMKAEIEDAGDKTLILTVRDESDAIVLKVRLACQVEDARSRPLRIR